MYIYLSLGEVRVIIIIIMQDIFFVPNYLQPAKKIATCSSESIKLVRGYSTARNDPWNVESLLSKDKERTDSKLCRRRAIFCVQRTTRVSGFSSTLPYLTLPEGSTHLISSHLSPLNHIQPPTYCM